MLVSCDRNKDIADLRSIAHRHDHITVHDGLERF